MSFLNNFLDFRVYWGGDDFIFEVVYWYLNG